MLNLRLSSISIQLLQSPQPFPYPLLSTFKSDPSQANPTMPSSAESAAAEAGNSRASAHKFPSVAVHDFPLAGEADYADIPCMSRAAAGLPSRFHLEESTAAQALVPAAGEWCVASPSSAAAPSLPFPSPAARSLPLFVPWYYHTRHRSPGPWVLDTVGFRSATPDRGHPPSQLLRSPLAAGGALRARFVHLCERVSKNTSSFQARGVLMPLISCVRCA